MTLFVGNTPTSQASYTPSSPALSAARERPVSVVGRRQPAAVVRSAATIAGGPNSRTPATQVAAVSSAKRPRKKSKAVEQSYIGVCKYTDLSKPMRRTRLANAQRLRQLCQDDVTQLMPKGLSPPGLYTPINIQTGEKKLADPRDWSARLQRAVIGVWHAARLSQPVAHKAMRRAVMRMREVDESAPACLNYESMEQAAKLLHKNWEVNQLLV